MNKINKTNHEIFCLNCGYEVGIDIEYLIDEHDCYYVTCEECGAEQYLSFNQGLLTVEEQLDAHEEVVAERLRDLVESEDIVRVEEEHK